MDGTINREISSRLISSTGFLINLQAKALLWPWHIIRLWLTGTINMMVAMFNLVGLRPNNYANRVKITELNQHIDVMHQREEEYRRRLQAMSEQLEMQSKDRSKALKKMHRARAEAETLASSLQEVQGNALQVHQRSEREIAFGGDGRLTHALLWGAVVSTYLSARTAASIQMKLMLTFLLPVVLIYFTRAAPGHTWKTVTIQCVSAGVLGFALNHLVC